MLQTFRILKKVSLDTGFVECISVVIKRLLKGGQQTKLTFDQREQVIFILIFIISMLFYLF